jgi:CRISPR-associated protein Cas2
MKGYGEPWQYSVFFCVLRDIDRARMQSELENEMNLREDQAIVLALGENEDASRQSVTTIGEPLPKPDSGTVVI